MKKFMISFILFFLISFTTIKIFSQEIEIEIDSTFKSSFEIFPFENIENVGGITMEGNVYLNSDTSLVRVVLEDDYGFQYMIFETYPLICPGFFLSCTTHCDETCFLEDVNPSSILIQVIDATLNLKSFHYTTDKKENAEEERYKAKRAFDVEKVETMNELIPAYGMVWVAGDNEHVALYYDQKKTIFGEGYNLRGYEYYESGVFEFLGHRSYPKVDPNMVWEFDWRNRHGVNDPESPYWNGDLDKAGWLTGAKNQGVCNSCWAFSAVGVTEALANLFSAQHLDLDLSEQDVLCNAGLGSCSGSFNPSEGLVYIKNTGVLTESCLPYDSIYYDDSCGVILPCSPQIPIINIFDTLYFNTDLELDFDNIRKELINKGPLKISYPLSNANHAVVLSGFRFNIKDSTLTWIIKNSWGNGEVEKGFEELKLDHLTNALAGLTPILHNDTNFDVECHDYDQDGYCFWGIGHKPASCDSCNCFEDEDCDDNNKYVGGYDENYNCRCIFEIDTIPHHITSDLTWADSTYVNYVVVVDSGASLTIKSFSAFAPEAKIIVKQGARLIIDGGYLTRACPDLWQGIEAWGSNTAQGFDQYFGHVIVQNNSVIEFAKNAVANYCTDCGYVSMESGGIIHADSSIFRNNETDVLLAPFHNIWLGREYPYFSGFTKCQFVTTAEFYPDFVPKAHIDLKDIYGLMIYGSTFENETSPGDFPFSMRGTGISGIDANFSLLKYCNNPNVIPCNDIDSNKFIGLEYGIKALNSRSKNTLYISDIIFDHNLVGISLSGIDYVSIISNDFHNSNQLYGIPDERFKGGIFLENCTGYHIENNFVHTTVSQAGGNKQTYGIGIKNSGPENNEIYNNIFEGLKYGIFCQGENRGRESGLCLKCNDMVSNSNDFIVFDENDPPLGTYQGISRYQGDPNDSTSYTAPAGNTFTKDMGTADSLLIKNYNYYNSAEDIFYTHHYHEYIQVRPMENHYTSSNIELKGWQDLEYIKATACPSGLGGGGGLKSYSSPRSTIHDADIQLDILNTQFDSLIDGGNTEALNVEVMTSMPDDGLEIRQELLVASPYLSDTVLKQAIYKENVLPNAMIRDVLEANPQSAKSDEILSTLNSRFESMPDYMMAQIMQGKKYLGAKELLEAKIQSCGQIRSKAKGDLMREFLLDTNMFSPLDSVIEFLENETDLNSQYDLALAQWDNSDLVGAWETVNMIPSQFALEEIQIEDHENYLLCFDILQTLADSNLQASQLDSLTVSLLFDLKNSGNPKISALARGLLVKGGFFKYIETVNFPDMTKSSKIQPDQYPIKTTNIKEDRLWLFPNPAGDYIIAYYNLYDKYKSAEIHLVGLKGDLLKSYHIKSGKDQIVIDLKAYPNGLYMISLNSRNHVIDIKKLIKGGN